MNTRDENRTLQEALANNSCMWLDTLGISAGAVRDRWNVLLSEGMERDAAFAQAVSEQNHPVVKRWLRREKRK